jgi:hypothetical protein
MRVAIRAAIFLGLVACVGRGEQPPFEQAERPEPGRSSAAEPDTNARGGAVLGVPWTFEEVDGKPRLHIGDRVVVLELLEGPCYATDELHGCWPGPAEIARQLIFFSPNYSPLAHPPPCAGIGLRVIDPEGWAVVGARVTPSVSGMIGPAGAFGVEGARQEVFERPAVETNASGDACVPDDRSKLAELHRARSGSSGSSVVAAVEVRFVAMTLQVEHPSWKMTKVEVGDEASGLLIVELEKRP